MRNPATYRGARRAIAKRLKLCWRSLERHQTHRNGNIAPQVTVMLPQSAWASR